MKTNITDNITIREVRISDSQKKIYNAIHLHRESTCRNGLPFVTFLTAEEEKSISELRAPSSACPSGLHLYH